MKSLLLIGIVVILFVFWCMLKIAGKSDKEQELNLKTYNEKSQNKNHN